MWTKLESVHLQQRPGARFNAYDDLFSIRKKEDESLFSLSTRIDECMLKIKNLRPKDFDLSKLDDELACMTMLRALPEEFHHLSTSLQLADKLDKATLLQAFITEDINLKRRAESGSSPVASALSAAVSNVICAFCSLPGHSIDSCFRFREAKAAASKEAQEKRQKRQEGGRKRPQKAHAAQDQSQDAPSSSEPKEFAGSASLDPSSLYSPLDPSADALWTADTGATSHMTPHRHWLRHYQPKRVPIRLANNTIVYSAGVGSVRFVPRCGGQSLRPVEFSRVLHVPALKTNLLSVLYLVRMHSFHVHIHDAVIDFKLHGKLAFCAPIDSNHSAFLAGDVLPPNSFEIAAIASTLPLDLSLWHRRLAHHNLNGVKALIEREMATGIKLESTSSPDPVCEPCLAGKMHANPFPSSTTELSSACEVVHSDLHGPLDVSTFGGYRYWVSYIDGKYKYRVVVLLKAKSQQFSAFKLYHAYVRNKGFRIGALQDDKGGEYMSKEMEQYCIDHGIVRRHTTRNRPQQNGVAERFNRLLSERITAMLSESNLPRQFWGEALHSFVHIINRCPTSSLRGMTPYEGWHGRKPDLSHLRVFGCTAYVHVQKDKRPQLGSHFEKCVFIGYPDGYKGWKFYNPTTRKVVISERAEFDERFYPGLRKSISSPSPSLPVSDTPPAPSSVSVWPWYADDDVPASHSGGEDSVPVQPPALEQNEPAAPPDAPAALPPPDLAPVDPVEPPVAPGDPPLAPDPSPEPELPPARPQRRSQRPHVQSRPSGLPAPSVASSVASRTPTPSIRSPSPELAPQHPQPPPQPPVRRTGRNNAGQPPGEWWKVQPDSDSSESDDELALAASGGQSDPVSFADAMSRPDAKLWLEAVMVEVNNLIANGTWDVCDLPAGKRAIGCKWVFIIKRHADGSVERYKARLVAKGFSQRPGFDYVETFAPTVRMATIRTVLALAALEDLELHSLDISQAFINGDLDTEIYMEMPEGWEGGQKGKVLRLRKALYGLKQAGRLWNQKLHSTFDSLGFTRLKSDPSVYVYSKDSVRLIIPIFIDDITIAATSKAAIAQTVSDLQKHFKLRDLGPTSYLLGIEITRDRPNRTLSLSQRQYIINMLDRFGFSDCNPVSTPMEPGLRLSADQSAQTAQERSEMSQLPYINAVGALMYLATSTRPDIAYTVSQLARFNSSPGKAHWQAVKHLFRYLKGTSDLRLTYRPLPSSGSSSGRSELFQVYSDADHAGEKPQMRSTGGYLVKMGSGAVDWSSKLQPMVALSTTEAEYIAACEAGKEILWMRHLFGELGYSLPSSSTLFIDNLSAVSVAKNPEHHGRMKHLDLRYHWLKETVESGLISPVHLAGSVMPADILTKALPRIKVEEFRSMMGLE